MITLRTNFLGLPHKEGSRLSWM